MATENLTLSEAQLSACKPIHGEGGRAIRAFCPFHGSDKQRSLRVDVATGALTALLVVLGDTRKRP